MVERHKMKLFRLIAILLLALALSLTLVACEFERQVIIRGDAIDWRATFPDPSELEYFDTIEEAVANHVIPFEGANIITEIGEIVRLFEGDGGLSVLFFEGTNLNGDAGLFAYMLYVKNGDGDIQYTSPFYGGGRLYDSLLRQTRLLGVDKLGEVRANIEIRNPGGLYKVNESENFIWGISQSPDIHYLRIDGQPVDDVVSLGSEGDSLYFWYFLDLQNEGSLNFENVRYQGEGEAVITMTPE